MNRQHKRRRVSWFLRPPSLVLFSGLVVLAIVLPHIPEPVLPKWRFWLRVLGYAAFSAMVVAYAYWPRQWFLNRKCGRMTCWLSWHIGASYAALGLTLFHGLGRAGSPLTFWMMVCFWLVIISGVVGHFGQQVVYRFLSLMVTKEWGMERLPTALAQLQEEFRTATGSLSRSPDMPLTRFLLDTERYVCSQYPSWLWLFGRQRREPVSANLFEQARKLSDGDAAREALAAAWRIIEARRQMDIEYWFHRLAACWLHVHRAAAVALAVLVLAHAVSSICYGGW